MIYDCFQFSNELEILDIRLNELYDTVDKFVLVESTVSHACKPKKLYFYENKNKFSKFKDKMVHIIVRDTPVVNLPWIVNDYQFCQISRGLNNCKSDDIVIFGDLDEIPKAEAIRKWSEKKGRLKVFAQTYSQYYLNLVDFSKGPWYGTRMTTFKDFERFKTPWIAKFSPVDVVIPDGGWHLTYMGGIKRIQRKISNMTHQEFNNSRYNTPEHILSAIHSQNDFLEGGYKFRIQPVDFLPNYVKENRKLFKDFILDPKTRKMSSHPWKGYLSLKKRLRLGLRKARLNE